LIFEFFLNGVQFAVFFKGDALGAKGDGKKKKNKKKKTKERETLHTHGAPFPLALTLLLRCRLRVTKLQRLSPKEVAVDPPKKRFATSQTMLSSSQKSIASTPAWRHTCFAAHSRERERERKGGGNYGL
jgi:hypothetical protein